MGRPFNARMRQDNFLKHRRRVLNAVSFIDRSPPIVGVLNYVKLTNHKEDADRYGEIQKANIRLLNNMTSIMRSHGVVQTFPKNAEAVSNLRRTLTVLREQDKQNKMLGLRVLGVKAKVSTHLRVTTMPLKNFRKRKTPAKQQDQFELPHLILSKYGENLKLPEEIQTARMLLRPRIYFELAIMGNPPLGRLVIKLYTEACPQVVLEFVRLCKSGDIDRLKIKHLFATLWLEGELQLLPENGLKFSKIEYDMRAIDHNQSPGVLSFARHHLKGMHDYLDFAISFRKLNALNGRRVGFGVVQSGFRLLSSFQEYGTRDGKPRKDIIITSCGSL